MTEFTALERRIMVALDRIGRGVEGLVPSAAVQPAPSTAGRAAPDTRAEAAEIARLTEALDAERTANAQLTERVRAIKERQENMVSQLERKVARLTQQLDAHGLELQRQKRIAANLTDTNRLLRDTAMSGRIEPHLINKSMLAEMEAMRAARATEIAELDEIMQELKPLIGDGPHA